MTSLFDDEEIFSQVYHALTAKEKIVEIIKHREKTHDQKVEGIKQIVSSLEAKEKIVEIIKHREKTHDQKMEGIKQIVSSLEEKDRNQAFRILLSVLKDLYYMMVRKGPLDDVDPVRKGPLDDVDPILRNREMTFDKKMEKLEEILTYHERKMELLQTRLDAVILQLMKDHGMTHKQKMKKLQHILQVYEERPGQFLFSGIWCYPDSQTSLLKSVRTNYRRSSYPGDQPSSSGSGITNHRCSSYLGDHPSSSRSGTTNHRSSNYLDDHPSSSGSGITNQRSCSGDQRPSPEKNILNKRNSGYIDAQTSSSNDRPIVRGSSSDSNDGPGGGITKHRSLSHFDDQPTSTGNGNTNHSGLHDLSDQPSSSKSGIANHRSSSYSGDQPSFSMRENTNHGTSSDLGDQPSSSNSGIANHRSSSRPRDQPSFSVGGFTNYKIRSSPSYPQPSLPESLHHGAYPLRDTQKHRVGSSEFEKDKEIYKWIDNIKNWPQFMKNTLGKNHDTQQKILECRGKVGIKLKMEMLKHWRRTRAHYKNPMAVLFGKMEEYLGRKIKRETFGCTLRLIADSIKNEKWLEFARLKLELRNDEIKEMRGKYAEFGEDQKYQLLHDWITSGAKAGASSN